MCVPLSMSISLPDSLPKEYSAKLALLEGILEKGVGKLLDEARRKGYSREPYGRKPDPTPLMSEEDFTNSTAFDEPLGLNDDPSFDFEYGFNPMSYLARYIRWSHPDSVKERNLEKQRCVERLHNRAKHAFKQLDTLQSLSETVAQQGSLVIWGPISSPLSPTSVVTFFQPGRSGVYIVEVSEYANFSTIFQRKNVEVLQDHNHEENPVSSATIPGAMQVVIEELTPSTKYYIRVYSKEVNDNDITKSDSCGERDNQDTKADTTASGRAGTSDLHSDSEQMNPQEMQRKGDISHPDNSNISTATTNKTIRAFFFSQSCSFWTLPTDEVLTEEKNIFSGGSPPEEKHDPLEYNEAADNEQKSLCLPVRLNCVQANFHHDVMPIVADYESRGLHKGQIPEVTCLLGDPVAAPVDATQIEQEEYTIDTWKFYTQNMALRSNLSLLRNSSLLLGWNDSRFGSDVDVRAEEVAFKRYSHDLKKHSKKYGKGGKKANNKAPPLPVLVRPQVSKSLHSLITALPIEYTEEDCSTRHIYRTMMLGPYVQLIILDLRSGYMSKEQAKWLKDTLTSSSTMWKVVISGLPIGVEAARFQSATDANDCTGGGNRPNSRHRSRIPSGTISLQGDHVGDGDGEKKEEEIKTLKSSTRLQASTDRLESEKEDCDEFGRSRTSLPYLISSIHRHFERKKSATTENETAEDDNSQGLESAGAGVAVDGSAQEGVSVVDAGNVTDTALDSGDTGKSIGRSTVCVESGIIFVSSNPDPGYGYAPFMAVYDPADAGTTYCAEVNIGSSGNVSSKNAKNSDSDDMVARGAVTEHLNTEFLQEENLSKVPHDSQYQSQLQLNDDGTLSVSIFRARRAIPENASSENDQDVYMSQTFCVT